jgi:osmoprotectant transport system permease protein
MEFFLSFLALLFFAAFIFSPAFTEQILKFLFSGETDLMYARAGLPKLLGEHTLMIVLSGSLASLTGIVLGIYVTRASGREYYPLVQSMASMAQTFPPTAVLALAVPVAGFGFKPVVIALFVYSIFPVINNTISGIEGISPSLTEASRGMGMTERQILFKTELPIAAKVIWAGIRTSTVINIGTATIGAVAGAGGLGRILMAGLIHDNLPYIFTGALSAALLAFFVDRLFAFVDAKLFSPQTNS